MTINKSSLILPSEINEFSRRQFISRGVSLAGYLSTAALMTKLGLNASAAYAQSSTKILRKLVWINMSGGWDLLETTDPKVNSNAKLDVMYGFEAAHALAGGDSNTKIGRWLSGIAAHGEDVVVVRGLAMGTTSHDAGHTYMDTSILSNNGRVNAASIPAIIASESEDVIPLIQLSGGSEPRTDRGLSKTLSAVRAENLALYRSMYPTKSDQIERKNQLLTYLQNSIARVQAKMGDSDRLRSLGAAQARIKEQIQGGVGNQLSLGNADKAPFTSAFQTPTNGPQTMRRPDGLIDAFALTLKLLKGDLVTCVNMGIGGFDTHANQEQSLGPTLLGFDKALSVFIDELKKAGKLDSTLIVLYSDFGRTPKLNDSRGRDHWPVGGALMIGGGIDGGRAVGGTDEFLLAQDVNYDTGVPISEAKDQQLSPKHLGGSVLELCLGPTYLERRPYLTSIKALTKVKG
jgi:hypothetical protein